jgi:hypothetical protein
VNVPPGVSQSGVRSGLALAGFSGWPRLLAELAVDARTVAKSHSSSSNCESTTTTLRTIIEQVRLTQVRTHLKGKCAGSRSVKARNLSSTSGRVGGRVRVGREGAMGAHPMGY